MSEWSETLTALGTLVAVSLGAVEPTPEEAWFAVDYATGYADGSPVADWSALDGTWRLGAADGSCSFVRGDEPYVVLNAVTNGYLDFVPTVPPETNVPEVITFRSEMRPYSSWVALPDLSVSGARGAVLAANRPPRGFVFFGWTKSGWEELAGVEVREDEMQEVCVEIDTSVQPPVVSYRVDGARLVSATNAAVTCFEAGVPAAKGSAVVSVGGSGRLGTFSATRESSARTAAVVKNDGSYDYFPSLSEAFAAVETTGGEVMLLRRTTLSDSVGLGEVRIASRLLETSRPPLCFAGTWPMGVELRVALPSGTWMDARLAEPAKCVANLHVHGAVGKVYRLMPDVATDVVHLSVEDVPVDAGAFTGWLTIPEKGRLFAAGLLDDLLGSNHTLFVQGNGLLTLCGTNEITGGLHFESGSLRLCMPEAKPQGGVTRESYHVPGLMCLLK
ncbi:MAG: hypothetical protein Q4G65_10835 [bacterium]|nr:hypothetical protein [bacterium]